VLHFVHTKNFRKKKSCVFATDFIRQKKYVQVSVHIFFPEKKEYRFRYTKNFRNKKSTDFGTDFNRQKKCVPFLIFCISFLPRCEIRNASGPDGKGGDEGAGALHGAKRTPGLPEMPPKK
jgi:hypothetical protein